MTVQERKDELRKLQQQTGLNRVQFANQYGIRMTTLDSWYYGHGIPESVLNLLKRAVNTDYPIKSQEV